MFDRDISTLLVELLTPPIPGNRSNTVNRRWSQRNGSFVSSLPSAWESSGRVSCGKKSEERGREGRGGEGRGEEGRGE